MKREPRTPLEAMFLANLQTILPALLGEPEAEDALGRIALVTRAADTLAAGLGLELAARHARCQLREPGLVKAVPLEQLTHAWVDVVESGHERANVSSYGARWMPVSVTIASIRAATRSTCTRASPTRLRTRC